MIESTRLKPLLGTTEMGVGSVMSHYVHRVGAGFTPQPHEWQ